MNKALRTSTDEAIALINTKSFIDGVNNPDIPSKDGKMIDPMINGAKVMSMYLDFGISSSVTTNPPYKVSPINVVGDRTKFGMKIRWSSSCMTTSRNNPQSMPKLMVRENESGKNPYSSNDIEENSFIINSATSKLTTIRGMDMMIALPRLPGSFNAIQPLLMCALSCRSFSDGICHLIFINPFLCLPSHQFSAALLK
jgi:hypothetical protein